MANPIDNNSRLPGTGAASSSRSRPAAESRTQEQPESRPAAAADRRIESERLQQVQEKIDSTPEVDMERVEAIKQAIAEGRYPIDAERIAKKFAEFEGLLNG